MTQDAATSPDNSRTRRVASLRGAASGAIAILPMTAVFWVARGVHLIDEVPPHKAIRSVAVRLREPALTVVSGIAHTAVGAGAGAVYCAMVPRYRRGSVSGALFGILVWVIGYEFVMPRATDIAPAHRDDRARACVILLAHVVYGAILGWRSVPPKLGHRGKRRNP